MSNVFFLPCRRMDGNLARYAISICAQVNSKLGAGQSSHGVMLHALAPSSISNFNRSSCHSVYMLMVALMASLWPGPTLAGRASAKLRHMPGHIHVSFWGCLVVGKWANVHVARFLPFSSGRPNQYFSRPPLLVASMWESWSSWPRWVRSVVGGTWERKTTM